MEFIEQAIRNREELLAPYLSKFLETRDPKIIVELIKLEPSHLDEDWIRDEIIDWLRRRDRIDLVEEAFMHQTDRKQPTEREMEARSKDFHVAHAVDQLCKEKGIPKIAAFRELVLNWEDYNFFEFSEDCQQPEGVIKKRYYDYRKRKKRDWLPYPYFGFDVALRHDQIVHRYDHADFGSLKVPGLVEVSKRKVLLEISETE